MKKHLQPLRLFLALFAVIGAINLHAAVIPYLPPLQNFGGTAVNLSTFVPTEANFTLEVEGSVGTQISIAGGTITYTPTTNGTVRFSQKNGVIYVYEGSVYKSSITPSYTIAYPTITDADVATNTNNLLRNASFETAGSIAGTGSNNYNFGTPWLTNITVGTSGGIRFANNTTGNVNGIWEIVWRGSANSNYFAQPLLTSIKSNTSYKFIVRQIAGGNADANFQFGLGNTVSGQEYGFSNISLGTSKNGTWSNTLKTPTNTGGTTYFTFKNTLSNSATSGSDPVTQLDYLALVEGYVNPTTSGITGVSSGSFYAGTAYAPEGISLNFEGGDNYELTSFITNPSFELNVGGSKLYGWTNNGFVTQTNAPGQTWIKDGSTYAERYVGGPSTLPATSISQSLSNLPNGYYQLTLSGHAIQQSNSTLVTTGAFAFAGTTSTAVNIGGNYAVNNVQVTDGTLNIGYKLEGTITSNWTGFDNFKLYYIGPELYPSITAPQSSVAFTTTVNTANIDVTGTNLTSDITITMPSSNISLSGANVTGTSPNYTIALANANGVNTVTATWDKTANVTGNISFTSGAKTKNIAITTSDVESVALAGITLASGVLSPSFAVGTYSYTTKTPADISSVTVNATTTPSIGNVTNSGTTISASSSSVVLTGNSYNGSAHTADYTVNWGGNYNLDDWDANGSTNTTLSIPTVYGWSATNSLTWSYANSSVVSSRYFDFINGVNGSNPTYKFNDIKFTGRVLLLRMDGGRVYSYPVKLVGGRTYSFSTKYCFHSTGTAGNLTIGFYTDKTTTTAISSGTFALSATAGVLQEATLNFTPENSGVYYLNFSNDNGNLCSVADLQITDNGASLSAITPSAGTLVPAFNANTSTYKVIVPDGTSSVTTNVTKTDSNASVSGDGATTLTNGVGTSTIVVTSADGLTSKTYTVNYIDQELKLKHAYTFEDGSANDSPANGASAVNGTISGTGTVSGGTYNPTTDGDYITLNGSDLGLSAYPAVTLEALITSGTTYENTYSMLAYFGAASGSSAFWIQPTRNGSDNSQNEFWGNAINGIELNDGAKHHLVSVLTSDSLYFYTDGYLVGKTKNTVAISNISPTLAYLGKGGWSDPSWLGSLHEFNIYSGKMDAATVKSRALNFVPATTYTASSENVISVSKSASAVIVEPGAKLTISAGKRLGATSITLQSSANGTATIMNSGTLLVDNANIQQYLTTKSAVDKTDNWWYISSPVSNATSAVILTEGSGNKFGYYNEATATYPQITATDAALTAGKGYVAQINTTGTYTFSGTLNNGDVPVTLTRTGNTHLKRGFNLVGNPYLSFLNWNDVKGARTDIRSTVWFRTRTAAGAMTFDTYNGLTGTSLGKNGEVTQHIPPMQAFWVKVHEDATSGDPLVNTINLTLTNNMRSHQDQTLTTNRLRTPEADDKQIIRINVTNGTNKDETILMSYSGAQDLMDTYDSEKISNNNVAIPEIYTLLNNEEITINTMNSLPLNIELPLGFRTGQAGNFTISTSELTNLGSDVKLILKDKQTSTETEMTVDNSYNFSSDAVNTDDRFTVILKATGVTTDVHQLKNALLVYGNTNNQIVVSGLIAEGTPVHIFNAVGQQIYQGELNGSYNVISQKLQQGVYIIKINQTIQKVTLK